MKVNVSNFIKELAEKAGIDANDATLIDVLSHAELNRIELPNEITSAINRSLLSLTDAKNNHPAVKSHYFAEIMKNVDRALESAYRDLELEQEVIDELNTERSSTKRIALLATKVADGMKTKIEAASKKPSETVASLNSQINDLNEKLRAEKEGRKKEKEASVAEMNTYKKNHILQTKTSGLKTIYDNLPSDVRLTTIDSLLNKELQDGSAQFILDESGNLILQKKDGSNYFDENNKQLSVDDFINKSLAKHKILQQNNAPQGEQGASFSGAQQQGQPPQVQGGQTGKLNTNSLFEESLQGLNGQRTEML